MSLNQHCDHSTSLVKKAIKTGMKANDSPADPTADEDAQEAQCQKRRQPLISWKQIPPIASPDVAEDIKRLRLSKLPSYLPECGTKPGTRRAQLCYKDTRLAQLSRDPFCANVLFRTMS